MQKTEQKPAQGYKFWFLDTIRAFFFMLNLFIWNFIDKTKRQIIVLWSKLFEVAFMKSTYAPMSYLFATAIVTTVGWKTFWISIQIVQSSSIQ